MSRTASTRNPIDENNLVDGVPPWMLNSVLALVKEAVEEHRGRDRVTNKVIEGVAVDRIHSIERYLQHTFPADEDDEWELRQALLDYCREGDHGLDVVEALLAIGGESMRYAYPRILARATQMLLESGSKWTPVSVAEVEFRATLEERVDQPTADAYSSALEGTEDNSRGLLKSAWSDAFGREPNAPEAYSNAIKAMEAAAWPVITPKNDSATLGHILGELRANPEKWKSAITEKVPGITSMTLSNAMQMVWEGHTDRHGTANPVAVTQEAAEQAVFTAVMVCAFFNRNYVEAA